MKKYLVVILSILCITACGFALAACGGGDGQPTVHTHDWGAWEVTTPATCENPGVETRYCALDETHKETRPVAALGHNWGKAVSDGAGRHITTCLNDSTHKQSAKCTLEEAITAPTCTEDGYSTFSCTVCDYKYEGAETAALGHRWGAWISNGDGTHRQICLNDETHTISGACAYGVTQLHPATCEEEAYDAEECIQCGHEIHRVVVGPALGHNWGAWSSNGDGTHSRTCANDYTHIDSAECVYGDPVVTAETCETDGYTRHTCLECRHYYDDEIITALGHNWGDWVSLGDGTHSRECKTNSNHMQNAPCEYSSEVRAATCIEGGYTVFTCTECNYTYAGAYTLPLGHSWGAWSSNGGGTHTHICANDAAHIETFECTYSLPDTVAPTCTEQGYTVKTCNICSHELRTDYVDATGHNYSTEGVITVEPGCLTEGEKTYYCLNDSSHTRVETVNPYGSHDYGNWTATSSGHRRICKRDSSHYETGSHVFNVTVVYPTCTSDGYTRSACMLCTYTYTGSLTNALGHKWSEWEDGGEATHMHTRHCTRDASHVESAACNFVTVAKKNPTCTEQGYTTYRCSVCGHTHDAGFVDATGHKYGTWQSSGDGSHKRVCANNSVHVEVETCTFVTTETLAPTCTEGGYTRVSCNVCTYRKVTEFTAALGHDFGYLAETQGWVDNGNGTHSRQCLRETCMYSETAGHNHSESNICLCGFDGLTYRLKTDGTYTVYSDNGVENAKNIVISSTYQGRSVTEINHMAFQQNAKMETLVVPDSVKIIGAQAFINCVKLKSVTIGYGIEKIDSNAFNGCKALSEVIILGENLVSISANPFKDTALVANASAYVNDILYLSDRYVIASMPNITTANIKEGTTLIAMSAFENRTSLASVNLPQSLRYSCYDAFRGCTSLMDVTFAGSLDDWFAIEFENDDSNPLHIVERSSFHIEIADGKIEIPSDRNITEIPEGTFRNGTGITGIVIPEGVTYIGANAFRGCVNLEKVWLPSTLTYIGANAFDGTKLIGEESNWDNGTLYIENYLISVKTDFSGDDGSYTVKAGTRVIAAGAFRGCTNLTDVLITSEVLTIGDSAFSGCTALRSATIGTGVTVIGANAFTGCTALESVTFEVTSRWLAFSRSGAGRTVTVSDAATAAKYLTGEYTGRWSRY